jgi:dienelactone hydrolase
MSRAGHFLARIAFALLVLGTSRAEAERIAFESAAGSSSAPEIFQGQTAYTDHIYGELQLPKGSAPFPAMVIMHSSRGVVGTILDWAKLFNEMGIATFVVDSFTPRGLSEASAGRLSFPADTVDALRAFQAMRKHSRKDSDKIGIIGF